MYFFLYSLSLLNLFYFFFFNDTATTEIYTLSLHDALPISILARAVVNATGPWVSRFVRDVSPVRTTHGVRLVKGRDRKSTRLNSSHSQISYAVFCLKKKKKTEINIKRRQHYSNVMIAYEPR